MIKTVVIVNDDGLFDRLHATPEIVEDESRVFLEIVLAFLQRLVQAFTPVGTTGLLRRSVKTQIFGQRVNLRGEVFTGAETASYAETIELGRTPGSRMSPKGVLITWIKRKFGVDEFEAERLEYPVARNIARFGFFGKPNGFQMFAKALKESGNFIENQKKALGDRIARRTDER